VQMPPPAMQQRREEQQQHVKRQRIVKAPHLAEAMLNGRVPNLWHLSFGQILLIGRMTTAKV
jgi:hypothetical protein